MALGLIHFPDRRLRRCARASLVAVWLATALVSVLGLHGQSRELLAQSGTPIAWMAPLILGGACLDLLIGLAMWRWHRRWVYRLAAITMVGLTVIGSVMQPSLWMDPLGCLSKNLPIAALLFILHADAPA